MHAPQAIYFCTDGVWICPGNDDPYPFHGGSYRSGSWDQGASDLIAIMVYHRELDITGVKFYVQDHKFAEDK